MRFSLFIHVRVIKSNTTVNEKKNKSFLPESVPFNNDNRQTIQFIQPTDAQKLGQAELVVIDEAAAIPLPLVEGLLGPYLVFMASTVNG
jgi:tRNA(Met) C34 N-acetyltransferase TmcA